MTTNQVALTSITRTCVMPNGSTISCWPSPSPRSGSTSWANRCCETGNVPTLTRLTNANSASSNSAGVPSVELSPASPYQPARYYSAHFGPNPSTVVVKRESHRHEKAVHAVLKPYTPCVSYSVFRCDHHERRLRRQPFVLGHFPWFWR